MALLLTRLTEVRRPLTVAHHSPAATESRSLVSGVPSVRQTPGPGSGSDTRQPGPGPPANLVAETEAAQRHRQPLQRHNETLYCCQGTAAEKDL